MTTRTESHGTEDALDRLSRAADRACDLIDRLRAENAELHAALKDAADRLMEVRDFFQEYVPLKDHHGRSLGEDWSWGPLEAAEGKARAALAKVQST